MTNQEVCDDLTITIPNYNCAKYLPDSINSIVNQTMLPKELVIIDDGSTDNSLEIIKEFQKKYDFITLLQNDHNQGVNYTANRGFKRAQTKYVQSFAADDWLMPTFVEQSIKLLRANPQAGLCSTHSLVCWEARGNKMEQAELNMPIKRAGFVDPKLAHAHLMKYGSWFMGNSVIMQREHVLEFGCYREELKSFSDNFLYRQIVLKYGACFVPETLSVWRIRYQSYSQATYRDCSKTANIMLNYMLIMEQEYPQLFNKEMMARELNRWSFFVARNMLSAIEPNWLQRIWRPIQAALLFVYFRPFDIWGAIVRKTT